jgi:hypothetical protein
MPQPKSAGTTKSIDFRTLVAEAEGPQYPNREHDAYEFSKKTFRETDEQGIYNGSYPD